MTCGDCGASFELSARNVRAARARGEAPRCPECRGYKAPEVTEAMRRWWLDRFTLDEIRDMATGVWPDG